MRKLFIFLLVIHCFTIARGQSIATRTVRLMGSPFDFTMVAATPQEADAWIDTAVAEVRRIEYLISDWMPETQVSQVNRNAGISPVQVDREVLELTKRALYLSEITNGAFDISFAAMDRIWKFDGSMTRMPTPDEVQGSVAKVGYQNILIDEANSTIFLKLPGMKIGFGALGEGYAADRCRKKLQAKGVIAGIVNGSGDMSTWGRHPEGHAWNIAVTNPLSDEDFFATIAIENEAGVTSGSYEKYVVFDGKRYAHIINPKTGYPASELASVTIVGPDAEFANGLSTSIMVSGRKEGLKLLRSFPAYRGVLVSDKGKVTKTKGMRLTRTSPSL